MARCETRPPIGCALLMPDAKVRTEKERASVAPKHSEGGDRRSSNIGVARLTLNASGTIFAGQRRAMNASHSTARTNARIPFRIASGRSGQAWITVTNPTSILGS